MQKVTKRKIGATLRKAIFTPSEVGPMRVIVDVGNIDYYILRAIECLHNARGEVTGEKCEDQLKMAMQLTALASVHNAES